MNRERASNHRKHYDLLSRRRLPLVLLISVVSIAVGLLASALGLNAFFVFIGLLGVLLVFLDTYHGLFVIMVTFPFLVGASSTVSVREQAFAILFATWFAGWFVHYLLDRSRKMNFGWHPVAPPALAVGVLLVTAALVGGLTGATPMDVLRDLSRYTGYFVLLPVAGIIRYRKSASRLLRIAILIGLPFYIWNSFGWWLRKFGFEHGSVDIRAIGSAYLAPIIGALWPLMLLKTGRWIRRFAALGLFLLLIYTLGSGYRGGAPCRSGNDGCGNLGNMGSSIG